MQNDVAAHVGYELLSLFELDASLAEPRQIRHRFVLDLVLVVVDVHPADRIACCFDLLIILVVFRQSIVALDRLLILKLVLPGILEFARSAVAVVSFSVYSSACR